MLVQDIAYEFTPKDVEEILGAVAEVEKRQLKVPVSCSSAETNFQLFWLQHSTVLYQGRYPSRHVWRYAC